MNTTNNNTPNNTTAENLKNLKQATDNIKAMMSGNTPAQSPLAAAVNSVTSSSVATLEPAAEVKTFTFGDMQVRMVDVNNEPLFCLSDICKGCGIKKVNYAIDQLNAEFEGGLLNRLPLKTAGGVQLMAMVSEPQMYFVMMRGRSQASKNFRKWICEKVIPSIRRTGSYIHGVELPKRNEFGKYDVTYTEVAKQLQDNYNMDENARTVMQWIIERAKKQGMIIGASMEQKKQSIISDTAAAQVSEVNKKEGEIMALKHQIEELNSKVALWKAESEKNWKECQLRGGALEVLLVHPQDPFVRNLAKSILGWNK
ncbi:BRO family protein [Anaerobiospirillum succiniciproducens]|uniref:BRO-N domain-containing protein n=1 Tax=Anaerobiospirillum succiniciproducens TaxID=13335 RepID=UPI002942C3A2|nr:BRO family protein [Anaerobiospirillum succiniciproducens]